MNKYRVESTRLKGYDYSHNGAYFITICSFKHNCLFGEIFVETAEMILSDIGKIVSKCWFDLEEHYPQIALDEFIIMPNHVHGIILIEENGSLEIRNHGLSEFVRAFKSFSSRGIGELKLKDLSRIWQSGFYDHIIHSAKELEGIRNYIRDNPVNWINDHYYGSSKKNVV